MRTAARRTGLTVEEYRTKLAAGLKWCRSCAAWQNRGTFGPDASRGDGLASACRSSRIIAEVGPGRTERRSMLAVGLAWCRSCAGWLAAEDVAGGWCREHRAEDARRRHAANPQPARERARARRRGLAVIPAEWVPDRRGEFEGLCAYGCGRIGSSWDHIWPVSRGGASRPGNLVPACVSCNSAKKDHDPNPWVVRGWAAFPDQWDAVAVLAVEHLDDHWVTHWLEAA